MGCRRLAQVSTSDEEDEPWRRRKKARLAESDSDDGDDRTEAEERDGGEEEGDGERRGGEEEVQEEPKTIGKPVRVSGKGRGRRSHFEAFEFDGFRYEIEDPVLLAPAEPTQKPYVAIIKDIAQERDGEIMVVGQWFYHPEEAARKGGGNWQSSDTRELFYSSHRDEVPAASVMHKCVVHFIPKNKQLPKRQEHPGFIVQKVYDTVECKLWELTDKDYEDKLQDEINHLVQETMARLGDLPDLVEAENPAPEQDDLLKGQRLAKRRSMTLPDVLEDEDATARPDQHLKSKAPGSCAANASEEYAILFKFGALTGDSHRDKWLEKLLQGIKFMCKSAENIEADDREKGRNDDTNHVESEIFIWPDDAVPAISALERAAHDTLSDFQKYNQKMQQLVFNLKNNSLLSRRLLNGELEPSKILKMAPHELKEGLTAEERVAKEPEESTHIQMIDVSCRRCPEKQVAQKEIIKAGRSGDCNQEMAPRRSRGQKTHNEEYFDRIRRYATALAAAGSSGVESEPQAATRLDEGTSGQEEVNCPEQGGSGPEEPEHEDVLIECIMPSVGPSGLPTTESGGSNTCGTTVPSGRHIRFRSLNSTYEEGSTSAPQEPKTCSRGLAKCKKLMDMIEKGPLEVTWDFSKNHILINNDPEFDSSQIIRFIGGHIRTSILPVAPTFRKLEFDEQCKIWRALTSALRYHVAPNRVYQWLSYHAQRRYGEFLGECSRNYSLYQRRPVPVDFRGREVAWDWMCDYFETPEYKAISEKMRALAENQKKHSGGSRTFDRHALLQQKSGALLPSLSTYVHVYEKAGESETVKKVREEIERQTALAAEAAAAGDEHSIPKHVEAGILQRLTGTEKKRGCVVPGMGGEFLRPPKPRGGARTAAASAEQIDAAIAARTAEVEERARARDAELGERAREREAELAANIDARIQAEVESRLKAQIDARLKAEVHASIESLLVQFGFPPHMRFPLPGGAPSPVVTSTSTPTPTPTPGLTQLTISPEAPLDQEQPPAPADEQPPPSRRLKKTKRLDNLL